MPTIVEVTGESASYALSEDNEFVCIHEEYEIDRACCNGYDSNGNVTCACFGQDSVMCLNEDCTGMTGDEVSKLLGGY